MKQVRSLLKGFLANLVIVGILVGVPLLLVTAFGRVPGDALSTLTDDLASRQRIVEALLTGLLVVVAWLAWLVIAVAIISEVIAAIRDIDLPSIPGIPRVVQRNAANLVAVAAMLFTAFAATPVAASESAPSPMTPVAAVNTSFEHTANLPTSGFVDQTESETATKVITVERRSHWWSLAEQHLGDGSRWHEIVEANVGRVMNDGTVVNESTPRPKAGWVLDVKVDTGSTRSTVGAERAHPAEVGAPQVAADEVVVQKGDNLWNLTETQFGETDMDRIHRIADANEIANPDLIFPGDVIDLDPDSAPTPTDVAAPEDVQADESAPDSAPQPTESDDDVERFNIPVGRPDVVAGSQTTPASNPSQTFGTDLPAPTADGRQEPTFVGPSTGEARSGESQGAAAVSLTRFAVAAFGILALLGARRRRQLRAHLQPATPGPEAAGLERQLRFAVRRYAPTDPQHGIGDADVDGGDDTIDGIEETSGVFPPAESPSNRIDLIGSVVYRTADDNHTPVAYLIDDAATDTTEVVFENDVSLAPPWTGTGTRWTIDWSGADDGGWRSASRGDVSPAPALVLLGTDPDGRLVYCDLETVGALEISGPEDEATAIASAIGMSLASRVDMGAATFVGIDMPPGVFLRHDGYLPADSFASGKAAVTAALGSTVRQPGPLSRLRLQTGEPWEPVVAVVGPQVGWVKPIELTGAVLISAAPIHGPSSVLSPDGDGWVLRPVDIRLTPCGISTEEVEQIRELFDRADSGQPPVEVSETSESVAAAATSDNAPQIMVRLFGGLAIVGHDGTQVRFQRASSRELMAWLVTHRDRSTKTGARASMWNFSITNQAFSNVLGDVRRSLNAVVTPPEGEDWLRPTENERLPLHAGIQSDAELLKAAVAASRHLPPAEQVEVLGPVVDLIEAAPFAQANYLWPDVEGIVAELSLSAAGAALRLAEAYRALGDGAGVLHATERGLRAIPGHEALTALRMTVADSNGDRSAVVETWTDYERALCDEPWAPADASEELLDLRRGLAG